MRPRLSRYTKKEEIDGVEHHVNPEGVTYIIPYTSGTKAYDAIYKKGVDHVHKVRRKLDLSLIHI